ncbi:MAG: TIGR02757 family protein [Cyclobacteriaceae bacterium]|nr:TIGR02757 family protein [Cyclobacteriaceae bacterium]
MGRKWSSLKRYLDQKYLQYNNPEFIAEDPICVPHQFSCQQDIEIAGFWTAMLAWGQRPIIIKKSRQLMNMMDDAPYEFVRGYQKRDLKPFEDFKHRTFNGTDTLYFLDFFARFYRDNDSLEEAFTTVPGDMKASLTKFHGLFFETDYAPQRTRKHVATPERRSACKRLNMFLRWMVRKDDRGVDFGLWRKINVADLICPCDLHVDRVARTLGLISRSQTDWATAVELTNNLKKLDPQDPVKYDFALFGLGVME